MSVVWFIGSSQERIITSSQWAAVGITADTVSWNYQNGWSINESVFSEEQLDVLDEDESFLLGQVGPRSHPHPVPAAGAGYDISAFAYFKRIKEMYDSLIAGGGGGAPDWNALTNKPVVIAAGATAAAARGAISAIDSAALSAAITAVINGAPTNLDDFNALAAAIGDDPAFAATMATALSTKAPMVHGHSESEVSGLVEKIQDVVAAFIAEGTGITKVYDDTANTLTLSSTGGGGATDPEIVRDAIGAALVNGTLINIVVDDTGNTITISTTATANSPDATLLNRANHTGAQAVSTITGLQATLTALATPAGDNSISGSKLVDNSIPPGKLNATGTLSPATVYHGDASWRIPNVGLTGLIKGPGIDIDNTDPLQPIISATPKGVLLVIDSSAAPTINTDLYTSVDITNLTTDITSMSANLFGSPVSLESKLLIRFSSAAVQNIVWGSKFNDGAIALPDATEANKPLLVGLIYAGSESQWLCEHVSTRLTAVSPPATPPLFIGDYSPNNFSQWQYVQNAGYNGAASGYTPTYRAAIVPDGTYGEAARYEVRAGDDVSGSERSEVRGPDVTTGGNEGDVRWYRWQTKFDPSFPSNHASLGWGLTNQFHGSAAGSSPPVHWSVGAVNGMWTLTSKPQSGPNQSGSAPIISLYSVALGTTWHDIKMEIKWSSDPAIGYIRMWRNGILQTLLGGVTQYFNRTKIPGYGTYYKEGYYRTPMAPTAIVSHTGFRCGTTEASVMG